MSRLVMRVVVIDDTADTRMLMSAYLTMNLPSSVRIHTFGDVEFRDGVDWDEVVVAIVDIFMPVIDGRDVLAWLRDEKPDIYRIAWTAADDQVRQEITEKSLAHAVIGKPGLEDLIELVRPLVGRQ